MLIVSALPSSRELRGLQRYWCRADPPMMARMSFAVTPGGSLRRPPRMFFDF
jgi:hypothetical protein